MRRRWPSWIRRVNEFDLIRQYFHPLDRPVRAADGVVLGIGDDCALLELPEQQLAMSIDTLVEGVHFLAGTDPSRLGHKALAVNLSDLAAMGAEPRWFMLCLTLPKPDAAWLQGFAQGLAALAARAGIRLIGGDTTRGGRSITIQVTGAVPAGCALRRDGAQPGDDIYVSGVLGQGGLGLLARQQNIPIDTVMQTWVDKLEVPEPRLALGASLRGVASACIDVSDGFLQDLQHILAASGVGACLQQERLPVVVRDEHYARQFASLSDPLAWKTFCLQCGDDYELCFTAPPSLRERVQAIAMALGIGVTRVGQIVKEPGLRADTGEIMAPGGYQHF